MDYTDAQTIVGASHTTACKCVRVSSGGSDTDPCSVDGDVTGDANAVEGWIFMIYSQA